MSPPLITRIDQRTGRRNKIAIPGWLALPLFRLLQRGKAVRGSAFDPFGYQAERKAERALIEQYILDMRVALATLRLDTLETAVSLASLPDTIRGFGPVKDNARAKAQTRRTELLAALHNPPVTAMAAE
jgi:indolepyruvate ferredoxin oxidoreductase